MLVLVLSALALTACNDSDSTPGTTEPPPPSNLALQTVASGLTNPIYLTAPAGDTRLFVVERPGRIRVIQNGTLLPTPFLDITTQTTTTGERGLLSVAFHPSFTTNGYFFIYYTDLNGDIQIDRYTVSPATSNVATVASRTPILTIPHPGASNHNGGLALFGPDGMLYLGVGDGANGSNAQSTSTLLGKLLRIDVASGTPYTIPSTNPFVGQAGARGEIWALGLRNPWRYTFDATDGLLYIADVGESSREEINVVSATRAGVNYGWPIMEGTACYNASTCSQTGLQLPVFEYEHSNGRCSITGGFVYRGAAMPGFVGHYVYSDYCAGGLSSLRYANSAVSDTQNWSVGATGNVLSFGQDGSKELYLLSATGTVWKIVTAGS